MKLHIATTILLLASLSTLATFAQTNQAQNPNEGTATESDTQRVRAGQSHSNNDGVKVENNQGSDGDAYISPKQGNANSETKVRTRSGFRGKVTGIDKNDTVEVGSNNDATVEGDGGKVTVGGGSRVTVTNKATAGGASIEVTLSTGSVITVPPGSTVTIQN